MPRTETPIARSLTSGGVCSMKYFIPDEVSTSMPPALLLNPAAKPTLPLSEALAHCKNVPSRWTATASAAAGSS
jgi:hypothetical protein